uniref:Uncharacterized protein n=1 Tax=Ditylenchus dipsaci TaxID=166011 RepID=A0A915EQ25_9BILA
MEIVLYKRRWFILLVISLISFSNNMTWISFAPISSYTVNFYGNSLAPTLFNVVFMLCSPMGFVSMWLIGKRGLRVGCLLGALLNLLGNLLRFYAATDHWILVDHVEWRFYLTLVGQILAACAQPFVMYLPTKLAAVWFPDSQRVLANTLASLSNPLGAATMYALAPHLVNAETPKAFMLLTGIVLALAVASAVLSLGVLSSRPPTALHYRPKPQVSKSFIILSMGLGSGFGLFNCVYNNLQPALCSKGYSNTFAGAMGAIMIIAGLVGSSVFGVFVDKTRLFEETMKVCMCMAAFSASALMVLLQFENMEAWLLTAIICFGGFSLAIYPIGMELGVETTFPAPPATSTGLLILIGQNFGLVYIFLTSFMRKAPTERELEIQTCIRKENPTGVYNWTDSFMVWNGLIVLTAVLFTASFWPKYKRMEYERAPSQPRPAEE